MDDADNTEESAEDITAADTEPSPKKAEIKKPDYIFFHNWFSPLHWSYYDYGNTGCGGFKRGIHN